MTGSEIDQRGKSRTACLLRWCWRHKLISLSVVLPCSLVAAMLLPMGSARWWAAHGYHPDIEAEGQLVDFNTRQPLADVQLAVVVRGWDWLYGGWKGMGGCLGSSLVIRTDAEGRYGYRVGFKEATAGQYERVDTMLRPYKYGYEAVYADDGQPDYRINEQTPGNRTIQPWPPDFGQARAMAMRKISVDADRDMRIKNSVDLYCEFVPDSKHVDGWVGRAAAIADDVWREWCTSEGAKFADRRYVTFVGQLKRFMLLRETIFDYQYFDPATRRLLPLANKDRDLYRPVYDGHVKTVPGFPWPTKYLESDPLEQRDFAVAEKENVCAFWKRDWLTTYQNWGTK